MSTVFFAFFIFLLIFFTFLRFNRKIIIVKSFILKVGYKMSLGNKEIMSKNIQYYMKKSDIDRKMLCSDLGLKYMTVSDWINAKTYPRIDKIEMLANYFGINKSDLVEEKHITSPLKPLGTKVQAIVDTINQLQAQRQDNVLQYAQTQLKEQNNIIKDVEKLN